MTEVDELDAPDEPGPGPAARGGGSVVGTLVGYLLLALAGAVVVSLGLLALVTVWRAIL